MARSLTIKSSNPNNSLILVRQQTVDADGNPAGPAQTVALLDDGEEWTGRINPNTVLMQLYRPRSAGIPAAVPALVSEPDVAETEQDAAPAVIGGADPNQPPLVAA